MHKAVVDKAADSQRLIKRSLLRVIGIESIFYTNPVHAYIIPQYNVKSNWRDTNTTKGICRLRKDGLAIHPRGCPNKTLKQGAFRPFW